MMARVKEYGAIWTLPTPIEGEIHILVCGGCGGEAEYLRQYGKKWLCAICHEKKFAVKHA